MNYAILYYLKVLIREGHKAQYQNMNGTGVPPALWFSIPQLVFIVLSFAFTWFSNGIDYSVIDYILSALSIMTALFMSLIVIVFDKMKSMKFKDENGKSNINHLHSWQYIYQFSSITSYATLLALLLIGILVFTLLFGKQTNLHEYSLVPLTAIDKESICLFFYLSFVVVARITFCYFLLDFLLMTLYAITIIYQSIFSDLRRDIPEVKINKEESIQDTINEEFGKHSTCVWKLALIILSTVCILYIIHNR